MIVDVILMNRWATFAEPYPRDGLRKVFGYKQPGYFFSPLYKSRKWDGVRSFLAYDRVPSGLFLDLKDKVEEDYEIQFRVVDERSRPIFAEHSDESDRPYQNECVRAMRKASKTGGIILNATGTGKTYIAGKYFKELIGYGVFIVNELGLLKQAQDELAEVLGERVGYIGDMKFKPRRITVATAQTLHRHRTDPKFKPWQKKLQTVIIDELHEMLSKRNHEIVSSIKPKACFGLTATLRHQKKHIRMKATALTGPLIYEFPLKEGVKKKYLTPGIVVQLMLERSGHKHYDRWVEYDALIARSKFYNNIVEKITRAAINKDKFVLQLVHRPAHVQKMSKRLNDIKHGTAYGAIKVVDRIMAKENLEKKKIRLIIANQVFKKGTNIKRVDLIIDAAGLPNYNDAQQKYGRGVRLCDNKVGLIYIDIGYKSPAGVDRKSFSWNRFERASNTRRKALKRLGVPIYQIDWSGSGKKIIQFAEKKLESYLRKVK